MCDQGGIWAPGECEARPVAPILAAMPRPRSLPRILALGAVIQLGWSFPAHADSGPEWGRLLACFNSNLATLIRSNETIESIYKATRAICEDQVEDALGKTFKEVAAESDGPKTRADYNEMTTYFRKRLDRTLFAYAVKFKAVGGPTTLQTE